MMIDWISGFVESQLWAQAGIQVYDTGQILARDPTGEIRRIGSGKVLHEGSFDSRLMVTSSQGHNLYLSGNPVKHIQGHNLFGSADAVGLFLEAGLRIRESVGLFPSPQTWDANEFVGPRFTRLDLTRSYRFPCQDDARAWIRDIAAAARSRHGGALLKGETVYFGQGSEHWSFKVYSKFDELRSRKKGHALPMTLSEAVQSQLLAWAEGVVRFELTLRSKDLARLGTVTGPSPSETMRAIWQTYYDRITWNRNAAMSNDDLVERSLSPKLRTALIAWRAGTDLRKIYAHRTWYRIRREILDSVGVDIASPPVTAVEASTVAPVLDEKGWDPEPLKAHVHEPDPALKKQYGLI